MEKITLFSGAENCCGCGVCMTECPVQAITMQEDAVGFQYPVIDETRCIQCGKCLRICPFREKNGQMPAQIAYAATGNDPQLVKNSASGGVFATVAQSLIQNGGLAAGAVMDMDKPVTVKHILSDKPEDLRRMQGSKYVQSDAFACYSQLKRALRDGKTVLFSGTPCQVAAVKKLTGDPEKLITMDLICHGVPSVRLLDGFLTVQEKRLGKIESFCFRDKTAPKPFTARLTFNRNGRQRYLRLRAGYLSFYQYFLEGYIYRESCYSCPYANENRVSDITVGDYWGIQQFHAQQLADGQMPGGRDWSCLIVNTEKGQRFLEKHGNGMLLYPTEFTWISQNNQQLRSPSEKKPQRETVLQRFSTGGYPAVEAEFIRENGGALRLLWRIFKDTRGLK